MAGRKTEYFKPNNRHLDSIKKPARQSTATPANTWTSSAPLFYFVKKLKNWIALTATEYSDLILTADHWTSLKAGDVLGPKEQEKYPLYILQTGIAHSFTILPNGERHISSVYYPGDILTYNNYQTGRMIYEFGAVTDCELTSLNPRKFTDVLSSYPNISQIITLSEVARTLFVTDRFAASTRLKADDRVLHLLLELKACEELTSGTAYDQLLLCLTQEQIADMLGLTSVYVSKVLTKLEADGVIYRKNKVIRFSERSRSELLVGFINRYQQVKGWKRIAV